MSETLSGPCPHCGQALPGSAPEGVTPVTVRVPAASLAAAAERTGREVPDLVEDLARALGETVVETVNGWLGDDEPPGPPEVVESVHEIVRDR